MIVYIQVLENGCTHYLLTKHWMNLRVIAEERYQTNNNDIKEFQSVRGKRCKAIIKTYCRLHQRYHTSLGQQREPFRVALGVQQNGSLVNLYVGGIPRRDGGGEGGGAHTHTQLQMLLNNAFFVVESLDVGKS